MKWFQKLRPARLVLGRKLRLGLGTTGLVLAGSGLALAAGFLTFGYPQIGVLNFTTSSVNGVTYGNGVSSLPGGAVNPYVTVPSTSFQLLADTLQPGGVAPQTVAISTFEIAASAIAAYINTSTVAAGGSASATTAAWASNLRNASITVSGAVTSVGGTLTLTLTNTLITTATATQPTLVPQIAVFSTTNTGGQLYEPLQLTSYVVNAAAHTIAWTFTNNGTSAINGTLLFLMSLGD